jgi:hypothetical protein
LIHKTRRLSDLYIGSTKTILIENRGGGYPIFSDFVGVQNNWLRKPVDVRFALNTVEKLCFKMSGDFICDLSGITYCIYEGVAEVA